MPSASDDGAYTDPLLDADAYIARMSIQNPTPTPVTSLPPHVGRSQGMLTLYADFKASQGDFITLYLINLTTAAVTLNASDGDIYVKQEIRDQHGNWHRAQSHIDATCGNSYHQVTVKPNEFIRVLGWMPKNGKAGEVRYQTYGKIMVASNTGPGQFSPNEYSRAGRDSMAIRSGDIDLINRVLAADRATLLRSQRILAIQRLRMLPRNESLPILKGLLADPDLDEFERDIATRSLRRVAPEVDAEGLRKPRAWIAFKKTLSWRNLTAVGVLALLLVTEWCSFKPRHSAVLGSFQNPVQSTSPATHTR
jgi:hypothetical protein